MRILKARFRKLWYIGLGTILALAPALTVLASDDGGSSSD